MAAHNPRKYRGALSELDRTIMLFTNLIFNDSKATGRFLGISYRTVNRALGRK